MVWYKRIVIKLLMNIMVCIYFNSLLINVFKYQQKVLRPHRLTNKYTSYLYDIQYGVYLVIPIRYSMYVLSSDIFVSLVNK